VLAGITRWAVLDLAADEGIRIKEDAVPRSALDSAQEAFLTGTTREITPVVSVDDRPIGTGRPGPVTQTLLAAFRDRVAALVPTR
jgi:branched-chain amino acid aminotransferase